MTHREEQGSLGGLEGLAFGVLLFAFGTLMVMNAWAVVDGKMAAGAAAREAARTYVEAPNESAARHSADSAAQQATRGRRDAQTTMQISPTSSGSAFDRCQQVTATVSLRVPRVSLPLIGGTGGTFAVSASHTEVIDPYRSGLGASAGCN
jgi:hypothetical protein